MAGNLKILETNNKCPLFKQATALIVGFANELSGTLANALTTTNASCKLKVHVSSSLPLPDKGDDERPRIDYVIFVVDRVAKQSLRAMQDSLKVMDVNYLFGKSCIVVTEVDLSDVAVEMEEVSQVAEKYSLPIFQINFQNANDTSTVAEKLLCLIEISAGLRPGINPLLIDTTRIVPNIVSSTSNTTL